MENENTFIYGNEKLLSFFSSAYENGKLAHAYIFEGGRGSGKHTLARRLSCLLACRSLFDRPCFMCESCDKISRGISPDVIEISLMEDKKTIGVEQIRDLRTSVFVKPTEEDIKIYIISNAEAMTEAAQNVFLKILEEPPAGVYFFMLCENTSNILATVKSRAPVLKMQMFSDVELTDYLLKNNKTAQNLYSSSRDEFELIVRIAEGKIGEAERLISEAKTDKSQSKHEKAQRLIDLCGENSGSSEFLLYVQNMAKNREELLDILLYSTYAVRDLMAVKKTDGNDVLLVFYNNNESAMNAASRFTSLGVMRLYDVLRRASIEVSMNANLNNTFANLAIEMKNAANM